MSHGPASVLVLFKTLTLVVGGLITYFAYRAYVRTSSPALRALTIGFGFVTVGSLLAGLLDQLLQVDNSWALIIESGFTLAGFAVILYSLYVD